MDEGEANYNMEVARQNFSNNSLGA
jgi:hypothetical protein